MTEPPIRLLVAICSLGTSPLLPGLLDQLTRQCRSRHASWRCVIVDNSRVGRLAALVCPSGPDVALAIVHEPVRGFSAARNAALELRVRGEYLAFLDDDEVLDDDWAESVVRAIRLFPRDILAGSVTTFRGRPSRPLTDQEVRLEAGMGNTVLPAPLLDLHELRFDQRYDRSGGEDTDFVIRARRLGVQVRAVLSIRAIEPVTPTRQSRTYLHRRERLEAAVYSDIARRHHLGVGCRIAAGAARLLGGGALLLLSRLMHRRGSIEEYAQSRVARGVGALEGLLGRLPDRP